MKYRVIALDSAGNAASSTTVSDKSAAAVIEADYERLGYEVRTVTVLDRESHDIQHNDMLADVESARREDREVWAVAGILTTKRRDAALMRLKAWEAAHEWE